MKEQLKWGIIGTGGIASDFARALESSRRCSVVNVCGTSAAKAASFGEHFKLPRTSASLAEMLTDGEVEAIYVASPHPLHAEQTVQCLQAGKAVLCEKPITLDAASAERVIDVARDRKVPLIEAWMYRCHPLTRALIERLRAGDIGQVREIKADFCFKIERDPKHRLFNPELGGGSILDVGGYPVSFSRLVAGVAAGGELAEPTSVEGHGVIGPTGVDEFASATLSFASGIKAYVRSAVYDALGTHAEVVGDRGRITFTDPWIPQSDRQCLDTQMTVHIEGKQPEVVAIHTELPTYGIEAEMVADTLPDLQAKWPAMSWSDTLGNMRVLDEWLKQVHTAK